jgi:CheY-like chemotaxis protein
VADEGLGFDPEKINVEAGFGLRNTRDRIELVGGSLQVEAAPGKGTRVTILAPVGPPGADGPLPEAHGPLAADGPLRKIRVLIAEDYQALRLMLADRLGHEPDMEVVAEAADGDAAVRLAQSLRPDVVVMDVSMPVMDGVQATRRLAAELPGIRVIGLSAYADAAHTEAMRAAGAVACLLKESSAERLTDAIRSCAPKAPA